MDDASCWRFAAQRRHAWWLEDGAVYRSGFSLIEVIGVLAILSVLAGVLLPRVFEAIHQARLGAVPMGLRTIKIAAVEHFVRYNTIASSGGNPLVFTGTYDDFDLVLVSEGLLDKPFHVKVGTSCTIRLVDVSGLTGASDLFDETSPGAFDLDGDGDNDIVGAKYLLEAVLTDPDLGDVRELNRMMDGPVLGTLNASGNDTRGKLIYKNASNDPNPNANPNALKRRPGVIYIHIAHR